MKTEPSLWSRSGKIVSLVNLRGAQLFIEATPLPIGVEASDGQVRVAPAIRTLLLRIGELKGFGIRKAAMTRHVHTDRTTFFEFRFSPTMDGILDLRKPARE